VTGWASLINEGNDRMGIPHQRRKRQDGHPSSTKGAKGWAVVPADEFEALALKRLKLLVDPDEVYRFAIEAPSHILIYQNN
jgi:hypothetical protein